MHIETADKGLATFVKRAIAKEMAKALKEDRVDLDDDGAVVRALYDKTFSSMSIAHLMDDAKAIARRSMFALPPLFMAAATAAILIAGSVPPIDDIETASVKKTTGKSRSDATTMSPRIILIYREAISG